MSTVAVIGASARAAAQSARRAGFHVVAADRFADADMLAAADAGGVLRSEAWDERLVEWLDQAAADAWLYVGPLENHAGLVDSLAKVRPLWGVGGAELREVRSPKPLAAAVRAAGCRFPETAHDPRGLPTDGSWLVKRDDSGGGCGVAAWASQTASAHSHPSCYWQRRLVGPVHSAIFCSGHAGTQLLAATEQLAGEPWCGAAAFHYCGTIAPLPLKPIHASDLQRLGDALAREFSLRGLFGVDFIAAADGPAVLEVNPRYTAAVEAWELATGQSALALHAQAFGSDEVVPSLQPAWPSSVVGKAVVYATQPAVIDAETAAAWLSASNVQGFSPAVDALLADLPTAGTQIPAGRPVLTALVRAHSYSEVRLRLERAVAEVYNQLARCQVAGASAASW